MHLPPPGLPRFGGGERPPFLYKPIAPLTITMGQRLGSLQALTPRERCCRFLIARPSGPLSRHRERGWGERADAPAATLGAILCAVRIDFRLPPQINPYPAQPATGVLGQSPKRVLVPFTRVKGTPRRRAVLTKFSKRLAPPEVIADFFTNIPPAGVQTMISKRLSPPEVIANYHLNIPPQVVRPAPVFTSAAARSRRPGVRPAPG